VGSLSFVAPASTIGTSYLGIHSVAAVIAVVVFDMALLSLFDFNCAASYLMAVGMSIFFC